MNHPTAFVIMPFASEHAWVFSDMIQPALEDSFDIIRADSFIHQHQIMRDVVHGIWNADLVVADLAGFNANVMYEVGVAHSLGIPTILICEQHENPNQRVRLPFDLGPYRVSFYSDTDESRLATVTLLAQMCRQRLAGELLFASPVAEAIEEVRENLVARARTIITPETSSIEALREYSDDELLDLSRHLGEKITEANTKIEVWAEAVVNAFHTNQISESIEAYALKSQQPGFGGEDKRRYAKRVGRAADNYRNELSDALGDLLTASVGLEESTDRFLALPWIRTNDDVDWAKSIVNMSIYAIGELERLSAEMKDAGRTWISVLDFSSDTRSAGKRLNETIRSTATGVDLVSAYYDRIIDVLGARIEEFESREA